MHILLVILAAAAGAFWYFRVFSRGAGEIADAAETIANIPRRRAFQKAARSSGYYLLDTPLEAAVGLMVSTAQAGQPRMVTEEERAVMVSALTRDMDQDADEADGLVRQVEAMLYDKIEPIDSVQPLTGVLHPVLERREAETLALTLEDIAAAGATEAEQIRLIAKYRERMNLL